MIDKQMTATRLTKAKLHVYNVCQLGHTITFIKAGAKDEFGEIITEETLDLKAHPIRYTPFDRRTFQNISWAENVEIIFYIARKEIDDLNLTTIDLKQYEKIVYDNREYEIRYVDNYSSFGTDALYIVVGGRI